MSEREDELLEMVGESVLERVAFRSRVAMVGLPRLPKIT